MLTSLVTLPTNQVESISEIKNIFPLMAAINTSASTMRCLAEQDILSFLDRSLNPSSVIRKDAERSLLVEGMENRLLFPSSLLMIINSPSTPPHIKQSASLLLKNHLRRHWSVAGSEDEADPIEWTAPATATIRENLKQGLLETLFHQNKNDLLAPQILESLALLAKDDFPHNWMDLLPKLCQRLTPSDNKLNIVVLRMVHRLSKRYRTEARSDRLYEEINYLISCFGQPFMELMPAFIDGIGIGGGVSANPDDRNVNSKDDDPDVLTIIHILHKIFISLCSQDLPAFFEDRIKEVFGFVSTEFQRVTIASIAHIKIIKDLFTIGSLYIGRYWEDVPEMVLVQYLQSSLPLLTVHPITSDWSAVSVASTNLLTTLSAHPDPRVRIMVFGDPGNITSLQNQLRPLLLRNILPSLLVDDEQLEDLEDDPISFIESITSFSSSSSCNGLSTTASVTATTDDSRRASAYRFIGSLLAVPEYSEPLTKELSSLSAPLLLRDGQDPKGRDVAITIFSSLTTINGEPNPYLCVPGQTHGSCAQEMVVVEYWNTHVVPMLSVGNAPFTKIGALRFLGDFRSMIIGGAGSDSKSIIINNLLRPLVQDPSEAVSLLSIRCIGELVCAGGVGAVNSNNNTVSQIDDNTSLLSLLIDKTASSSLKSCSLIIRTIEKMSLCVGGSAATAVNIRPLLSLLERISASDENCSGGGGGFETCSAMLLHSLLETITIFMRFSDISMRKEFLFCLQRTALMGSSSHCHYAFEVCSFILEIEPSLHSVAFVEELAVSLCRDDQCWKGALLDDGDVLLPAMARFLLAYNVSSGGAGDLSNIVSFLLQKGKHQTIMFAIDLWISSSTYNDPSLKVALFSCCLRRLQRSNPKGPLYCSLAQGLLRLFVWEILLQGPASLMSLGEKGVGQAKLIPSLLSERVLLSSIKIIYGSFKDRFVVGRALFLLAFYIRSRLIDGSGGVSDITNNNQNNNNNGSEYEQLFGRLIGVVSFILKEEVPRVDGMKELKKVEDKKKETLTMTGNCNVISTLGPIQEGGMRMPFEDIRNEFVKGLSTIGKDYLFELLRRQNDLRSLESLEYLFKIYNLL